MVDDIEELARRAAARSARGEDDLAWTDEELAGYALHVLRIAVDEATGFSVKVGHDIYQVQRDEAAALVREIEALQRRAPKPPENGPSET